MRLPREADGELTLVIEVHSEACSSSVKAAAKGGWLMKVASALTRSLYSIVLALDVTGQLLCCELGDL